MKIFIDNLIIKKASRDGIRIVGLPLLPEKVQFESLPTAVKTTNALLLSPKSDKTDLLEEFELTFPAEKGQLETPKK